MRRPKSSKLLALWKLGLFSGGSLVILSCYLLCRLAARGRSRKLQVSAQWTRRWAAFGTWCAGYRVLVRGDLPPPGVLLTPMHLGYVDILVIGSLVPTFFVAKAEVSRWPLFGLLAGAGDHVFATRRRTKEMRETAKAIAERIEAGARVCIFLEGTSGGGDKVLPFRSSFLQPGVESGAVAIPAACRWFSHTAGFDPSEDVAYWGDHSFLPHVLNHLGHRRLGVEVVFGDPYPLAGRNRKEAATHLHECTAGLLASLTPDPDPPPGC